MAQPGKPLLEASSLTRRDIANGSVLLNAANICLAPGDRIAITGPTGSGKSVLLRALALLDSPDGGTLLWRGQSISASSVPTYRRHVSYIAQRPAILDGTVESNLRYPFSLGVYRDAQFNQSTVKLLLKNADRDDGFLNRSATDLSGGESQIVALIRVLQLAPDVLLLDEPTASLDPDSAAAIESLVIDWLHASPDRAYIWVSHDQEQAARMASRHLIMRNGTLVEAAH